MPAHTAKVSDFDGPAATVIRRARKGEATVITANGQPVAQVAPIPSAGPELHLPRGPKPRFAPRIRMPEGASLSDAVIEDRR